MSGWSNSLGSLGDCETLSGWDTAYHITVDSSVKLHGSNSFKGAVVSLNPYVSKILPCINSHKYYVAAYCFLSSYTSGSIDFVDIRNYGGSIRQNLADTSKLNMWQRVSDLITATVTGNMMVYFGSANTICTATFNIDAAMVIDLTYAFGAGNEPTKAWCDANIPFGWFGTKTFSLGDSYNFADLNRINGNIQYLDDVLSALGYAITFAAPKVNYTRTDFPKVSDINTARANLTTILQNFYAVSAPSMAVDNTRLQVFDYVKANAIELNIQALYDLYNNVVKELKYSGTLTCGQDSTFL